MMRFSIASILAAPWCGYTTVSPTSKVIEATPFGTYQGNTLGRHAQLEDHSYLAALCAICPRHGGEPGRSPALGERPLRAAEAACETAADPIGGGPAEAR